MTSKVNGFGGAATIPMLALLLASAAPAAEPKPRLGEPHTIAALDATAQVVTSASSPGRRAFVVAEDTGGGSVRHVVVFRRADAGYQRFALPAAVRPIQQVRVVPTEQGGLVAWDDGDRIAVQSWHADGRVDRPVVALSGVRPALQAAPATPNWTMTADGQGAVAIVALRAGRGTRVTVQAALREPRGAFAPAQQVATLAQEVRLGPPTFADDGALTVRWVGGAAIRSVPGAPFGAAVLNTWEAAPGFEVVGPDAVTVAALTPAVLRGLPRGTRRVLLAAGEDTAGPVAIGPATASLCRTGAAGCRALHRFVWPGEVEALAFLVSSPAPSLAWQWYVARRGPDGSFIRPRYVSVNAGLAPLRGSAPGRVDFVGVNTAGIERASRAVGARAYVMSYGTGLADTRAPSVTFSPQAGGDERTVAAPMWCSEQCSLRIRARVEQGGRRGRWRSAAALDENGSYALRPEPFQTVAARVLVRMPPGARLRIRVTATDVVGHVSVTSATFRPILSADGRRAFCRAGAPGCR